VGSRFLENLLTPAVCYFIIIIIIIVIMIRLAYFKHFIFPELPAEAEENRRRSIGHSTVFRSRFEQTSGAISAKYVAF
jgi:hypothetical protein